MAHPSYYPRGGGATGRHGMSPGPHPSIKSPSRINEDDDDGDWVVSTNKEPKTGDTEKQPTRHEVLRSAFISKYCPFIKENCIAEKCCFWSEWGEAWCGLRK